MEATVFNPIQKHLLQMFQRNQDEERLKELKEVLFNYYCNKLEKEVGDVWEEKNYSDSMFANAHFRTAYKLNIQYLRH